MMRNFYNRSIFKAFFDVNDSQVVKWAENVLKKMEGSGTVPAFIKRSKAFSLVLGTSTHLFALIVEYAKKFSKIEENPILFESFIQERGLITTQINTTSQRQHIFNNYINEYRKRGTIQIVQSKPIDGHPLKINPALVIFEAEGGAQKVEIETRKDWVLNMEDRAIENIPGELLRLVDYKKEREFIFAPLFPENTGWCLGHSSPCWQQTEFIKPLIKGYEATEGIEDVTLYPTIGPYTRAADDCLKFATKGGGIDFIGNPTLAQIEKYGIKIYNGYDYELSCTVRTDVNVNSVGKLGAMIFDSTGRRVYSFWGQNEWTGKSFPQGMKLKSWWQTQKAYIRAFTTEKKAVGRFKDTLTLPTEENLYLLLTYSATEAPLYIKSLKLQVAELPFRRGYTGKRDIVTMITPNKTNRSNEEIERFATRYLFPYHTLAKWKF